MIRRLEINRRGVISLLVADGGRTRWFDLGTVPPRQLDPRSDEAVPLSMHISARRHKILNYRPGRRLVVADREKPAVLKGWRTKKFTAMEKRYRYAECALAAGPLGTARILVADPETSSLRLEHLPGKRPSVRAGNAGTFRQIGSGLRSLQCAEAPAGLLEPFDRQHELEVVDERLRRLELAGGAAPANWDDLRAALVEAAPGFPDSASVPCHRDFHDGQVLTGEQGPVLLDFDLLCLAEPELDAANFLAHLDLRALQRPKKIDDVDLATCRQAFLDGCRLHPGSGRLAFYEAATLARLSLVYLLRPRWQHLSPVLAARGLERLRGAT